MNKGLRGQACLTVDEVKDAGLMDNKRKQKHKHGPSPYLASQAMDP